MRALELDINLADAHAALGAVRLHHDWDWAAAEAEFVRATELNAGCLTAHLWYAELLSQLGRHEEAIAEIGRALQTDPLSLAANAMAAIDLPRSRPWRTKPSNNSPGRSRSNRRSTLRTPSWRQRTRGRATATSDRRELAERDRARGSSRGRRRRARPRVQGRGHRGGVALATRPDASGAARGYVPPALMARAHAALGDARGALALARQGRRGPRRVPPAGQGRAGVRRPALRTGVSSRCCSSWAFQGRSPGARQAASGPPPIRGRRRL